MNARISAVMQPGEQVVDMLVTCEGREMREMEEIPFL